MKLTTSENVEILSERKEKYFSFQFSFKSKQQETSSNKNVVYKNLFLFFSSLRYQHSKRPPVQWRKKPFFIFFLLKSFIRLKGKHMAQGLWNLTVLSKQPPEGCIQFILLEKIMLMNLFEQIMDQFYFNYFGIS